MANPNPTPPKPTVLITGCSNASLGAALALSLHATNTHRVIATARTPSKLITVRAAGIETLPLDVLSPASIAACVAAVADLTGGSLDMLVNNAGATMFVPLTDASLPDARKLFDLNVWAGLAMVQAFLPLLLRSQSPMIVNHTSTSSVICPPFSGLYGASKAATAMLTVCLRAELRPFGIKVVELKSGSTSSQLNENQLAKPVVGEGSLYWPAREWLERLLTGDTFMESMTPAEAWARKVGAALTRPSPPDTVWVGTFVWSVWLASFLPSRISEALASNASRVDLVEKYIREYGREKAIVNAYSGH